MEKDSALEKLEENLYGKEDLRSGLKPQGKRIATPPTLPPLPPSPPSRLSRFGREQVLRALWVAIGLAVLVGGFIFWRGFFVFEREKVEVTITAPEEVEAGTSVIWQVTINNKNRSGLTNGELVFSFPPESKTAEGGELLRQKQEIPEVPARGKVEYDFTGIVMGGEEIVRIASASFSFKAEKSNLSFHQVAQKGLKIASFPIELTINGPFETISGETVEYGLELTNTSLQAFEKLRVRLEYPSGFIFVGSDPVLDANHTFFDLDTLEEQERRTVTVRGTLSGEAGESKILHVFLEHRERTGRWEVYKERVHSTLLSPSPLSLMVDLRGREKQVADPGEELVYRLHFKNDFDVPLAHLTLSAALSGTMVDFTTLKSNGDFNSRTATLVWTEAHVPELALLAPGEEGEVTFTVSTKKSYTPLGVTQPSVVLNASLVSPTRPPGLTVEGVRALYRHETKVRGRIELTAQVFYNEVVASFRNTGPYPPRVGEETTFTVHWQLKALANGFENVTIAATLPSGIEWAGETTINGSFGELGYDEAARKVTWFLPDLKANQGILSTLPTAIFKVRARPAPAQKDRPLPLLSKTELRAKDAFTTTEYTTDAPSLDSGLGTSEGKVE